jgi:hypothetical protein
MSTRSFAAFLNEVKSDEAFARDLKSALVSVNKDEISVIVAEFAHRKGIVVDLESLKAPVNIASYPEFSDSEIEYMYANKWTAFICSLLSNCNCTRDTDCQEYCG